MRWRDIEKEPPPMTGNEIAAESFNDFEAWRQARHPERYDHEALAEEYGMDCAAGSWLAGRGRAPEN